MSVLSIMFDVFLFEVKVIAIIVIILIICAIHFIPSIVADYRKLPYNVIIWIINALFGWTGIGWIILLLIAIFGRK